MAKLKVAAAQIAVALGDLAANLAEHRCWIERAAAEDVELLLFPELSLSGYQLGAQLPDIAMGADHPALLQLAQVSPERWVVCGFVEQAATGQFFNSMAWLKNGQVQYLHRKLNLPTYGGLAEGRLYTPGQQLKLQQVASDWPAATLICADLWNPGLVHAACCQWPNLLLAPINSAEAVVSERFSNPEGWALNLAFYSMTYRLPIVMANRCDWEGDIHFWGGSRILGARGECLAEAGGEPELISASLDTDDIAAARFELLTMRDANPELLKRLL